MHADSSDEQLLAAYIATTGGRSGREAAFEELVVRYRRRLFAICVRVLGSPQDAEEAVQETFIRLARHADTFRGDAKLSTWLYRVAHNVCTDRVRYEARRPSTPVADVTEMHDHPDGSDPIAGHATIEGLRSALAQLDERSRTLVLLVTVDGLSYAEAAEATGLAVGTVKSRVSRARVQLGEFLQAADTDTAPAILPRSVDGITDDRQGRNAEPRGPPTS